MTRLPRLKGKEIVKALEKSGFTIERIRGSHIRLKHPDGRATSVPVHSGEIIGPGLLRSILRNVDMSVEEFCKLI